MIYDQNSKNKRFDLALLFSLFFLLVLMIGAGVVFNVFESLYATANSAICFICVVFCIILHLCCMTSEMGNRRMKIHFELMVFLLGLSALVMQVITALEGKAEFSVQSFALMTFSYLLSVVITALFWLYQSDHLKNAFDFGVSTKIFIGYLVLYLISIIINIFTPVLFFTDESGILQYPLDGLVTIGLSLVWMAFYVVIIARTKTDVKSKLLFASYVLIPLIFSVVSAVWLFVGVDFRLESMTVIASLISMYLIFFKVYQEQSKLLREKEKELSEKSTQMMLSQIQPHFLYNALSAISAIPQNPDETREALSQFGKYLRGNLNSVNLKSPIPFEQEIKHVNTYLDLEKLRFGKKLKIVYRFNDKNFKVPALSVQMFVENAVKHGITKKENGGTLVVSADLVDKEYVLTIKDNGVGFNSEKLDLIDSNAHIGIKNATNRIKNMVNGTVEIKSEIGEGTTVTIRIPKTEENEDEYNLR